MIYTAHTVKIGAALEAKIQTVDSQVSLSFVSGEANSNFRFTTLSGVLDPNTAKALGAALYLSADRAQKQEPTWQEEQAVKVVPA